MTNDGAFQAGSPRRIIESLLGTGNEVGRTYFVYLNNETRQYQAQTIGAAWTDANNLLTVSRYNTNGNFVDDLVSVRNPDGTKQVYFYETNSTPQRIITVLSGQEDPSSDTNILSGTKTVTIQGQFGETLSRTNLDIASTNVISKQLYSSFDSFHRPQQVTYLDGTSSAMVYDCCNLNLVTERDGTTTTFAYDPLKRQVSSLRNSITVSNIFDAANNLLTRQRLAGGTTINLSQASYDKALRPLSNTTAVGNITTYAYSFDSLGQLVKTTTQFTNSSSGITTIETTARDGSLTSVTGTAVHGLRFAYGVEAESGVNRAYTKEIKLNASGTDSSEWTKAYRNQLGQGYKMVYADSAFSISYFNSLGQQTNQIDPDGVRTMFQYNLRGEREYTIIDMNRDGVIDWAGSDRIRRTVAEVTTSSLGVQVQRTRTMVWMTPNVDAATGITTNDVSTDGLHTWQVSFGLTNRTDVYFAGSGNRYVTNTAPDGSRSISYYQYGQLKSVTQKDSGGTQIGQTTFAYDSHGRQITATDARNGSTSYGYDSLDRVTSITTPQPGTGQHAQTTSYTFDSLGRGIRTTLSDGTSVTNEFYDTGELKKTTGSRTYPSVYVFDYQGRMIYLTNWTGFGSGAGARTTTWIYNANRGFLTTKNYPDGYGLAYTYTPAGRLRTRLSALDLTTTYATNAAGELVGITYPSGTPNVTFNLDRVGRATNIIDGTGTNFIVYHDSGLVISVTNVTGLLAGLRITNGYDGFLRRTQLAFFTNNATPIWTTTYGFDGASRLTNVTDGTYSAAYSFLANSPLVSQITFRQNTTTRMTTTKQYDYLNRLLAISSLPSAAAVVSSGYLYNDGNQRIRNLQPDGSYWIYQYDSLGQVISGKKYWSDGTPVAGQQFEYAFDDIGNRTSTKAGGDQSGAGLRSASYSVNNLNQYTSRDFPGTNDVIGIASALATVTVNGQSPYRHGEYYQKALATNNGSASVYFGITNKAVLSGTTNSTVGYLFLPKTPETFGYDFDGNLTNDGRWALSWDSEFRLINVTSLSGAATLSRYKVDFAYDYMGRRVQKIVSTNNGSIYVGQSTNRYVYDGWNLIAILDHLFNTLYSFQWGSDLSGSLRGAGGVGGLVSIKVHSGSLSGTYFYAYDGNGNVAGLVSGADGTIAAQYEYGSFGELIRASGSLAFLNPFRFSSKFQDEETGFLYYGFRFYNPSLGRWLSRDPIGEKGGRNLYGCVGNNPISFVDPFGATLYPSDFIGPLLPTDWRGTVFKGFENPRYQQHDQRIHDLVNDFNVNKAKYCGCTAAQVGRIPDADFDQVKSWLIQESGGSDNRSRAAWNTDPAQVNVPGDWSDWKGDLGLTQPSQRNEGTLNGNLKAALGWLCRKGFGTSGQPPTNRPAAFFDGWFDAFRRYNGRTDPRGNGLPYSVNYATQIITRAASPGVYFPLELP